MNKKILMTVVMPDGKKIIEHAKGKTSVCHKLFKKRFKKCKEENLIKDVYRSD